MPSDPVASQPEWAATAAALLGDRKQLLKAIAKGDALRDRWSVWRPDQPRCARWRDDATVMSALKRLSDPLPDTN
jgi:hypothetical protein